MIYVKISKIIRSYFFLFFLFLNFVNLKHINALSKAASNKIKINYDVLNNVKQSETKKTKKSFSKNPEYKLIENEIKKLKAWNRGVLSISLDSEDSKFIAPTLCFQIKKNLKSLIKKAKIKKRPKIFINVGSAKSSYNASAKTTTKQITTTRGNEVVKIEKKKDYKLTLGENLLKLIFWNKNSSVLLRSVIAHEVGHMASKDAKDSKAGEFEADKKAVKYLGKKKALNLAKAINMLDLADNLSNILLSNLSLFKIEKDDVEEIVRKLVNRIIEKRPSLGKLGKSKTHLKFGHTVKVVLEKVLDDLNDNLDDMDNYIESFSSFIFDNLNIACKNPSKLFEKNDLKVTKKFENIENYQNQFYSPDTHPAPYDRFCWILKCTKAIKS